MKLQAKGESYRFTIQCGLGKIALDGIEMRENSAA